MKCVISLYFCSTLLAAIIYHKPASANPVDLGRKSDLLQPSTFRKPIEEGLITVSRTQKNAVSSDQTSLFLSEIIGTLNRAKRNEQHGDKDEKTAGKYAVAKKYTDNSFEEKNHKSETEGNPTLEKNSESKEENECDEKEDYEIEEKHTDFEQEDFEPENEDEEEEEEGAAEHDTTEKRDVEAGNEMEDTTLKANEETTKEERSISSTEGVALEKEETEIKNKREVTTVTDESKANKELHFIQ